MRMSIKAAVVAAASTALLVPAASAFADSAKVVDATNDTWKMSFDEAAGQTTFTKSDKTANVDIAKSVIKHTNSQVRLVVDFASLKKDGMGIYVQATLKTDQGGKPYDIALSGYDDGQKWLIDGVAYRENATSAPADECMSLDTTVDWKADTVTVAAPRSCFGKPSWVEAHVVSLGSYQAADGSYVNVYDNGHNDTHDNKGWTGKIKKG